MKKLTININGVDYTLKFGYGALRLLADVWRLKGIQEVINAMGDISGREIEVAVDLVWAAIAVGSPDAALDTADVGDYLLAHPDKMPEVMEQFMASMPQPQAGAQPAGKLKAAKTPRNPNR